MRDAVFYMRMPFPFTERGLVSRDLVNDAKLILDLDLDLLKALANELESYSGFLDGQTLKTVIGHYVSKEDERNRLSHLISAINEWLRSADKTLNDLLASIHEWQKGEENHQLLSPEEFEELQRRMPIIVRPYPGLKRLAKAKHLSDATGLRLEQLDIICDLRPVFDENRTSIEGIIPFTTLRVVCKGVDGLPLSLEAVLSEVEVADLAKKAAAAVEKLNRLREFLVARSLPIPAIEITKKEK